MTLRTQLRLHTLATVITALIIGAVLFGLHWKIDRLYERELAVLDLASAIYQKRNFTLEYLVSPHQRVIDQWNSNHKQITELLRQVVVNSRQERLFLEELAKDHQLADVLFVRLTKADTRGAEARAVIAAQMLIKAQNMVANVRQLDRIGRRLMVEAQGKATRAVIGLIAGLVIVVAILGLRLGHRIMGPLRRLMMGAEKVGAGDLDYRIGAYSRDELGELATRFDRMTASLAEGRARQRELHRDLERRVAQRTAQLEAVNSELETFSYSVSHDLRVPLRAIDGFSRIIFDEYHDKLDAEGKRLLNVVRENTRKMGRLIDDILAFSRTGRQEMKTSEIDMTKLVSGIAAELKPLMAERDIMLDVKSLPPTHADRAMMVRVFNNLLANAVKFTRLAPKARIEVGAIRGDGENIYYVKDNGVGFDMQYAEKLFGVFQRLHNEDEFEGSGIGLAVVKRVITRHGGRVWAEGKVNEGATFYFALP